MPNTGFVKMKERGGLTPTAKMGWRFVRGPNFPHQHSEHGVFSGVPATLGKNADQDALTQRVAM
jgi:hypothetical protein